MRIHAKHNKKVLIIFALLFVVLGCLIGYWLFRKKPEQHIELVGKGPDFLQPTYEHWADSVLQTLSHRQRILQLIFWEHNDSAAIEETWIETGGVLLQSQNLLIRAKQSNRYLQESKTGVLLGAEAEFGLSLAAHADYSPPAGGSLLNFDNDSIRQSLSYYVAEQLSAMRVHINFAPSLAPLMLSSDGQYDLQNEKLQNDLALAAYHYHTVLAKHKIVTCITGFPNMRFSTDKSLVKLSPPLWSTLHHNPFIQLVDSGIQAISVMHYPYYLRGEAYHNQLLHKPIVDDSLRRITRFEGLVISDLRHTENARIYAYRPLCLDVLLKGSDMLLIRDSLWVVVDYLEKKLSDKAGKKLVAEKAKRVLMLKAWAGAHRQQMIQAEELKKSYHPTTDRLMAENIYGEMMVLLRDRKNRIPIHAPVAHSIMVLHAEKQPITSFLQVLCDHFQVSTVGLRAYESKAYYEEKAKQMKDKTLMLFADESLWNENDSNFSAFVQALLSEQLIVVWAGGYASLDRMHDVPTLLITHGNNKTAQRVAAHILAGAMPVRGKLPFTCSDAFCYADGELRTQTRLKFTIPEEVGIRSEWLKPIDSIAHSGINRHAMPGCQVFVAIEGRVIFQKSYGYHTYSKEFPVQNSDIYDLASVTKVATTTLCAMKLYDEGRLHLDTVVKVYLPETKGTELGDVRIRNILIHKAGFPAVPPIFRFIRAMQRFRVYGKKEVAAMQQLDDSTGVPSLVNKRDSLYRFAFLDVEHKDFPLQIAEGLYLHKDMPDSIWKTIVPTKINSPAEYKYSDMSMYVMMRIIESIVKRPLDEYASQTLYAPLMLQTTGFNPLKRKDITQIVPTENEKVFRRQLIHGFVHDPIAALLGGVSGHAGLFSNATDLGILLQMVLNGGTYAGVRFFSPATTQLFTASQSGSHRGLGWDHQFSSRSPSMADSASQHTYGHLGFTGTCVWVDPKYEFVFVFLSNRVYPDAENKKLIQYRIRQNVQQVVYRALWMRDNPVESSADDEPIP